MSRIQSRPTGSCVATLFLTLGVTIVGAGLPDAFPSASAAQRSEFRSPYNPDFVAKAEVFESGRTPAVSFSNQVAGNARVDPLVEFGEIPSDHLHTFLGSRLGAFADVNALFNEPRDWAPGSIAQQRGVGFGAEVEYLGARDGYTPGVWWPAVWDAPPGKTPRLVEYRGGIATYYVRLSQHGSEYLHAYPNGLAFLIHENSAGRTIRAKMEPNQSGSKKGNFRINFHGPTWWDGVVDPVNFQPHVSYQRTSQHTKAIPQFQTYLKARLAYPNDPTPLDRRIRLGHPTQSRHPHMDYVAGFRQDWLHQWLLDLGPNWGHLQNPLRTFGTQMPTRLTPRKLEGVNLRVERSGGDPPPSGNLPDVVVDSVFVTPTHPDVGEQVSFQAVVRNIGTEPTPIGVRIGVAYRVQGGGHVGHTWGAVSGPLDAGASVVVGTKRMLFAGDAGSYEARASVDDVNRFEELDETNNVRSVSFIVVR